MTSHEKLVTEDLLNALVRDMGCKVELSMPQPHQFAVKVTKPNGHQAVYSARSLREATVKTYREAL